MAERAAGDARWPVASTPPSAPAAAPAIQKGYSSTYLAMGFADVRAGTQKIVVLLSTRPNISESHSETSTRVPFCIAKCPQFFAPMARACFPRQHAGGPPQYRVLTSTSANKAHAVRVSQSASFPAASGEWLQHASFDSELAFVKAFGRVHEQHYQKDYPVRKPSSHANLARASVTVRSELASRCTVIPNSEIA